MNVEKVVINIYNNESNKTAEAVEGMVKAVPSGRHLEVYDSEFENKVIINDDNKHYFENREVDDVLDGLVNVHKKARIIVRKPSLDMKSKWTVNYDRSIEVDILDKSFSDLVKGGTISFSNGTVLVVDLEIISYPNNSDLKPVYNIIKVHTDELSRYEQISLNFD